MDERHFEILEEMIVDFNEYSTDYTKTRCKELEQVLIDTLNYITNLQEENCKLKKENKILRENAEHNDKVVDKVNWENQKLVKVIEELETWLKEKQDLTCGCGITAEYIYAYENALDKLTELKGGSDEK